MYYRSGQVYPFVLTTGGLILANKFERPQRMSDRVENAGMGDVCLAESRTRDNGNLPFSVSQCF